MWLWLSLICASSAGAAPTSFPKSAAGTRRTSYSHLKMVIAVGVVMGLHAAYEIFVGGTVISLVRHSDLPARVPAVYQLHGLGLSGPAVYRAVHFLPHLQLLRRTGGSADAAVRRR